MVMPYGPAPVFEPGSNSLPKIAESGVAFDQVTFVLVASTQLGVVVSHVPAPSALRGAVAPLESQVRLPADALPPQSTAATAAETLRMRDRVFMVSPSSLSS